MRIRNRNNFTQTSAVKYFMDLHHRATIYSAIERAASGQRERLLAGFENLTPLPVDVESIAESRGIRFAADLPEGDERDAELNAVKDGFILRMNPRLGKNNSRRRFTIAHEIGHTFFFNGIEHQVGITQKDEREAEEDICFMFARALLIPPGDLKRLLSGVPHSEPWEFLQSLERTAKKFRVSLEVFIRRISEITRIEEFPYILVFLKFRENRYSGSDECLRVAISASVGDVNNLRIWTNRSAKGVRLNSADELFNSWKHRLGEDPEVTGGRYVLASDGDIVRASSDTFAWLQEDIEVSINQEGEWHNELLPMMTTSCLYAAPGWTQRDAYVLSIMKNV